MKLVFIYKFTFKRNLFLLKEKAIMKVYLDNNATTIVDPHVFAEMEPYFVQRYGNPNSLHLFASETHPALKEFS